MEREIMWVLKGVVAGAVRDSGRGWYEGMGSGRDVY